MEKAGFTIMNYSDLIIFIMEMMGTVAFAASGAMLGIRKKMDLFGVCVLGVTTSVGGGAIRDVTLGIIPPGMFRRPIYTIDGCYGFTGTVCASLYPEKSVGRAYRTALRSADEYF